MKKLKKKHFFPVKNHNFKMSPHNQQSSNQYDNDNGHNQSSDNITYDDMPELEDPMDFIENPINIDSYYTTIWYENYYNGMQPYVDQNNLIDTNPAEETDCDEQDDDNQYYDDMPELENDQNVIFSDSFMDNVEVNDNVLDIGTNFDFLVDMN